MHPRRFKTSQSRHFAEQKKNRTVIIILLVLVSGVTWIFTASRLSRLGFMNIAAVEVTGADKDIAPTIQNAALSMLDGDYVGLFSRANTLIYPHSAVVRAAAGASSRVASVAVWRDGLAAIHVAVTEKDPAAIVCPSLPDLTAKSASENDDSCYFADDSGYLFKSAPAFSGAVYNRYYAPTMEADSSGSSVGFYATSSAEFAELQTFYNGIKSAGMVPDSILIKEKGEYELYIDEPVIGHETATSTDTSNTVVVYFNNARPFSEELTNLSAFWHTHVDAAREKHEPLSFEYIDVRYGANVFYRSGN